jgi:quinol monooxygenase YgiN
MILSIIELSPSPGKREKVLELLRFCIDRLSTKGGCLDAGVYQASNQAGTILYLERWESNEDFRRYVQSDCYLGVLAAIDLAKELPTINFLEVSNMKSLELIVALRSGGSSTPSERPKP